MKKHEDNIQNFSQELISEDKDTLSRIDALLKPIFGEVKSIWTGAMWGGTDQRILSYRDYTYTRPNGKTIEWFAVGVGFQKKYISLYINAVDDNKYIAETYASKLGKVKVGKSSVSFARLDDVNTEQLVEMLKKAELLTRS